MAIITISRQMGSGSIPIAHELAEKLGYTLVDGEAIMQVAESYGLSAESIEQADEKPPHFVEKMDFQQVIDLHLIELIVLEYALKGNVIIYGRGGQDLLKDIRSVLRVRIIAPFEDRVEHWAEREWIDPDQARVMIRKSDQQRAGFIKYYFDRDWDDPLAYDLTINTQRLSLDMAGKVISDGINDQNLLECKADCKKTLTDLILRKRIEIAILSSGEVDAYLLDISVVKGVATLSGQLHSKDEKKRTLELTRGVEGVNEIIEEIRVVEFRTTPSED
ncbi:MAG: cytidylate kinase family protein [Desulfuromonadales bacterium]|nr:cytidylate kinase family protein [Desulfuromonadales bacterium]